MANAPPKSFRMTYGLWSAVCCGPGKSPILRYAGTRRSVGRGAGASAAQRHSRGSAGHLGRRRGLCAHWGISPIPDRLGLATSSIGGMSSAGAQPAPSQIASDACCSTARSFGILTTGRGCGRRETWWARVRGGEGSMRGGVGDGDGKKSNVGLRGSFLCGCRRMQGGCGACSIANGNNKRRLAGLSCRYSGVGWLRGRWRNVENAMMSRSAARKDRRRQPNCLQASWVRLGAPAWVSAVPGWTPAHTSSFWATNLSGRHA